MKGAQVLFTSDEFPADYLNRFMFAVMGQIAKYYVNGVERPVDREECATFFGYTTKHIDKLTKDGVLTAYRFESGSKPLYLLSECMAKLKSKT
jgi:hypothetical protein